MNKKTVISATDNTIHKLKVLAKEKESVGSKLVVTAKKLSPQAKEIAVTTKEKDLYKNKKTVISATDNTILELKVKAEDLAVIAKEKENIRLKLEITAGELAKTAKEKEDVKKKLEITAKELAATAKEKEDVRKKLAVTARELKLKAEQLAVTAKEKEDVRKKLAVTARELKLKAEQLAVTAKEKETVRKELVIIKNSADAALKYAENIIDTVREPMLALDQNLRVVKVNRSFYEFFKVTPKETVGKLIFNLGNKQWNIPKLRELLENILPKKTTFDNYEVEHDFTTIGKRTMLLNARQIEQEIGQKRIILLAIEDITEKNNFDKKLTEKAKQLAATAKEKEAVRKKLMITAEELKKSRQTLENKVLERTQDLKQARAKDQAILASIGDGMVVVDKEGQIIYINQAFEEIIGWKMQEILNKHIVEIIPREDKNGKVVLFKERILTQVLLGKKVVADLSEPFYYLRKNKDRFPAASTVAPIILNGKIIGAVETFRDITKEKEIEKTKEKQLQHEIEIEAKERDFISMASHQLLTPLTLMKGYTSMLISGKIGKIDEEAKQYLQESLQGSDRMSNLVKSLLITSRIESENIKVLKVNFDLNELIRSVASELKSKLEGKKLTIKVPTPKKFLVFADKNQTREIFMNVLGNAIKYSETGTITISESQTNSLGTISIKDTGIGINQKDLPHIFEKFYASENWLQKQSESHGLGLYIAKLFLKLMGGNIRVESKVGEGSTFFISLPLTKNG